MSNIQEVAKFMELGEQNFPETPTAILSWEELEGIVDKMKEEVKETNEALLFHVRGDKRNAAHMIDGAIDTAYVALSLAIKIAGVEGAQRAWDEVSKANLSKVDGTYGPKVIDENGVVKKPEGFKHPNIYNAVFGKQGK